LARRLHQRAGTNPRAARHLNHTGTFTEDEQIAPPPGAIAAALTNTKPTGLSYIDRADRF